MPAREVMTNVKLSLLPNNKNLKQHIAINSDGMKIALSHYSYISIIVI